MRQNTEAARAWLLERNERLKNLPTFAEPTRQQLEHVKEGLEMNRAELHKVDRGFVEVAVELDWSVDRLKQLMQGEKPNKRNPKRILDIGCGVGSFAAQAARLKGVEVVALDHDPEVLDRVPKMANLRVVQGSGYDLLAALGDEEFDVVVNSFSSLLWAETPQQKLAAVDQSIAATRIGGTALLIPIVSNPSMREIMREKLESPLVRAQGSYKLPQFDFLITTEHADEDLDLYYFGDWCDVVNIEQLLGYEESGQTDVTFTAFRNNSSGNLRQERYSAAVKVLDK